MQQNDLASSLPNDREMADRARELEDWADAHLIGPHGITYTYLDRATQKPATDDFFGEDQDPLTIDGFSPAEWHSFENCTQATCEHMMGLLLRYAVESDPEALRRARVGFDALRYIYQRGLEVEAGFMPKLYGDRMSRQTSSDQTLYAITVFHFFQPYASPAEQKEIDRMIVDLVTFWVKRDYKLTYFWWKDMQWPLGRFTSKLLMAINHGGGPELRQEYERLLALGVNKKPVEARLWPKLEPAYEPTAYERQQNAFLVGDFDGSVSMDIMELDYLLRYDPGNAWAGHWKRSIQLVWDEGKLAVADDGTELMQILVDMDTHAVRRPEPCRLNIQDPKVWQGFDYVHGGRSWESTYISRAGLQGYMHTQDPSMLEISTRVLRQFDIKDPRAYLDPERYAPPYRHRTELLSGDAVGNWLWGYWLGRSMGVFQAG